MMEMKSNQLEEKGQIHQQYQYHDITNNKDNHSSDLNSARVKEFRSFFSHLTKLQLDNKEKEEGREARKTENEERKNIYFLGSTKFDEENAASTRIWRQNPIDSRRRGNIETNVQINLTKFPSSVLSSSSNNIPLPDNNVSLLPPSPTAEFTYHQLLTDMPLLTIEGLDALSFGIYCHIQQSKLPSDFFVLTMPFIKNLTQLCKTHYDPLLSFQSETTISLLKLHSLIFFFLIPVLLQSSQINLNYFLKYLPESFTQYESSEGKRQLELHECAPAFTLEEEEKNGISQTLEPEDEEEVGEKDEDDYQFSADPLSDSDTDNNYDLSSLNNKLCDWSELESKIVELSEYWKTEWIIISISSESGSNHSFLNNSFMNSTLMSILTCSQSHPHMFKDENFLTVVNSSSYILLRSNLVGMWSNVLLYQPNSIISIVPILLTDIFNCRFMLGEKQAVSDCSEENDFNTNQAIVVLAKASSACNRYNIHGNNSNNNNRIFCKPSPSSISYLWRLIDYNLVFLSTHLSNVASSMKSKISMHTPTSMDTSIDLLLVYVYAHISICSFYITSHPQISNARTDPAGLLSSHIQSILSIIALDINAKLHKCNGASGSNMLCAYCEENEKKSNSNSRSSTGKLNLPHQNSSAFNSLHSFLCLACSYSATLGKICTNNTGFLQQLSCECCYVYDYPCESVLLPIYISINSKILITNPSQPNLNSKPSYSKNDGVTESRKFKSKIKLQISSLLEVKDQQLNIPELPNLLTNSQLLNRSSIIITNLVNSLSTNFPSINSLYLLHCICSHLHYWSNSSKERKELVLRYIQPSIALNNDLNISFEGEIEEEKLLIKCFSSLSMLPTVISSLIKRFQSRLDSLQPVNERKDKVKKEDVMREELDKVNESLNFKDRGNHDGKTALSPTSSGEEFDIDDSESENVRSKVRERKELEDLFDLTKQIVLEWKAVITVEAPKKKD